MIRTDSGWTYADEHGRADASVYERNHLWKPMAWFWYVTNCTCGEPEGLYGQFRRFWLRMEGECSWPPAAVLSAELNVVNVGRFVVTEAIRMENINGNTEFTVRARVL